MRTASVWKNARIEVVRPESLVLEDNSRTIVDIKSERPDLINSIRDIGVLVPPIANEQRGGNIVVKDGFSRTLAAQVVVNEPEDEDDANLEIPVIVTTSQDEEVWRRLRDQWVMNQIRAEYNADDKARILEQFSLFGFSDEEIARQLQLDTEQVSAGLAVQRSTTAKTLMAEHPQLDLIQLGAITEFEHNEDALARLQGTMEEEPEQFDHEVARLRQERVRQEQRDQIIRELTEQGVNVVEKTYSSEQAPLRRLQLSKTNPISLEDNPNAHADCPGHAALVETAWLTGEPRATYVCQDWKSYGHIDTYGSSGSTPKQPKSEYEKAELRRAKTNNADWRAAEEVRRSKLAEIVKRKTPPKRTQQFIATAMIDGTYELGRALERRHSYACQLLGLREPHYGQKQHPMLPKLRKASTNDALMLQLAMVLAAYEDRTSVQTWRGKDQAQQAYFRFLRDNCGYTLSHVERLVLDPAEDIEKWPHLQEAATSDTGTTTADVPDSPDDQLDGGADASEWPETRHNADADGPALTAPADSGDEAEDAGTLAVTAVSCS